MSQPISVQDILTFYGFHTPILNFSNLEMLPSSPNEGLLMFIV